jgi:dienelactone hydrolase
MKLMNEKKVKIPIQGTDFEVHGILRGDFSMPVVLLAHGLGGWMHDVLMFNASRYLSEHRFASLRIDFYGWDKKQRDIQDCYVKTFAEDIDTSVSYIKRQGAKWIGAVGHSYGGLGIIYSNKQAFDAAVLWDPTHTDGYDKPASKNNLEKDFIYIKNIDSYITGKGYGDVLSRKVFEDYAPGSTAKAKNFNIDTLVINADFSEEMKKYGKNYANSIDAHTKHIVIPGSTHPFVENGAMEKLFEETLSWLQPNIRA